jgi:hypothetical protein
MLSHVFGFGTKIYTHGAWLIMVNEHSMMVMIL